MKKLNELTLKEYTSLNKSGMLYEFYPEATGSWDKDCKIDIIVDKGKMDKIKTYYEINKERIKDKKKIYNEQYHLTKKE